MIFIHKYSTGDITMLHHIKKLFGIKPKEAPAPIKYEDQIQSKISISFPDSVGTPYKVPEPAATTPIPLVAEQASQAVIESIAKPAKKKPSAKKAPAAKKPRASKKPKPV